MSNSAAAMTAGAGFVPAFYYDGPARYVYFVCLAIYAVSILYDMWRANE